MRKYRILRNARLGDKVHAVASSRSAGQEVSFGEDKILKIEDLSTFDFSGVDIALFSPGGAVSAQFAPKAAAAGCIVIDNTSHFRMDPDCPLIVPEVNAEALEPWARVSTVIRASSCRVRLYFVPPLPSSTILTMGSPA